MIKRKTEWMTLSKCLKVYALYTHHEKKGLIKIHEISIDQEEYDESNFHKIKTGKNKGKLRDDHKHVFSVSYETLKD